MAQRWRLFGADSLLIQVYEDGAVIYCRDTGDTHQLNLEASTILLALRQEPLSSDQLLESLARDHLPVDLSRLESLLRDLQHLGVIQRAAS